MSPSLSTVATNSKSATTPFTVRFYDPDIKPRVSDFRGRTLDDILSLSDEQLEWNHDYIQVLFPLPERSPINPSAPVLTAETRREFQSRPALGNELRRAFVRMLKFYGFEPATRTSTTDSSEAKSEDITGRLRPSSNFAARAPQSWLTRFDHNHLRITRILRCLRVLGLEREARAFLTVLLENDAQGRVSERTKIFWTRAAQRPLWMPPTADDGSDHGAVHWLRE